MRQGFPCLGTLGQDSAAVPLSRRIRTHSRGKVLTRPHFERRLKTNFVRRSQFDRPQPVLPTLTPTPERASVHWEFVLSSSHLLFRVMPTRPMFRSCALGPEREARGTGYPAGTARSQAGGTTEWVEAADWTRSSVGSGERPWFGTLRPRV